MTAHLHLHLEPEVRKRLHMGDAPAQFGDADAFFRSHSLQNPDRPSVNGRELRTYIQEVEVEQREQGVRYVELRLSPRRFLEDGMTWPQFFQVTSEALRSTVDPIIRGILLINRDSTPQFVSEFEGVVAEGVPPEFVGVDLAGDERAQSDSRPFQRFFAGARTAGLGATVHAGEFGDHDSVWQAIEVLGAQRIGHGLAAVDHAALLARLASDQVLIEVSLTSSAVLGSARRFSRHPVSAMLDAGVPISFNTDVPLHTGASLSNERNAARDLLGVDDRLFDEVQRLALSHAFARADV